MRFGAALLFCLMSTTASAQEFAIVTTNAPIYAASVFGPPPPDEATIAYVGHAQWLLVGWGYWLDRHRVAIRQW